MKDCVTAVTKTIKKRLSGDVVDRKDVGTVVELQVQASLSTMPEAASTLFAAMTKAACGADKGSTKLPTGAIIVDAAAPLPVRTFADCVRVSTFRFEELPTDNPTLCAIAEATYIRHLQRSSDLTVYGVGEFPPCLLRDALSRFDVSVGGYVVLSIVVAKDKSVVVRLFTTAVDTVMSSMCSTAFTSGVLPATWAKRSSLEPHQLLDALEDVQLAISEYWHDSAQDDHARSVAVFLMSSVGSDICDFFTDKIAAAGGVFRGDKKLVEEAHLCCEEWVAVCGRLTTLDWASEWGKRYEDAALVCVRDRLRTALVLRGIIEEVSELLGADDFRALKTGVLWDVFSDVAVMDSSASVQNQWNAALAAYYRRLEPIEHRCATVLRELFAARAGLAPQAILSEFSGYCHLMKRPIIARELVTERDGLLGKLNDRLAAIRLEYEHRAESTEDERVLEEEDRRCQTGRFFPGVVNNIIWLRQLRGRIEEMI